MGAKGGHGVCSSTTLLFFFKFILRQGLLLSREFTCCRLVSELSRFLISDSQHCGWTCASPLAFTWAWGIQTQVLMFVHQDLYKLSHLFNPISVGCF